LFEKRLQTFLFANKGREVRKKLNLKSREREREENDRVSVREN